MNPMISFSHSNLYLNTGLVPAAGFSVGHATNITITLKNTGGAGNAIVHLWWIGPSLCGGAGPMIDLVNGSRLAPPYGPLHPLNIAVGDLTGNSANVSWTPSAADFPHALGPSVPGCLFAQVVVKAAPPVYAGDTSALTIWSPAYALCAQHNIHIAT
jgi:hypothetical protein